MTLDRLVEKIVWRLRGLNLDNATTTERQIFSLLVQGGFMVLDEHRNMIEVERKQDASSNT